MSLGTMPVRQFFNATITYLSWIKFQAKIDRI